MHTHSQKTRDIGIRFKLLNCFGKDRGLGILHLGQPILILADIGHMGQGASSINALALAFNTLSPKKKRNPFELLGYLSISDSAVHWAIDFCPVISFFLICQVLRRKKSVMKPCSGLLPCKPQVDFSDCSNYLHIIFPFF